MACGGGGLFDITITNTIKERSKTLEANTNNISATFIKDFHPGCSTSDVTAPIHHSVCVRNWPSRISTHVDESLPDRLDETLASAGKTTTIICSLSANLPPSALTCVFIIVGVLINAEADTWAWWPDYLKTASITRIHESETTTDCFALVNIPLNNYKICISEHRDLRKTPTIANRENA